MVQAYSLSFRENEKSYSFFFYTVAALRHDTHEAGGGGGVTKTFHDTLTYEGESTDHRLQREQREILDARFECWSRNCGGKTVGSSLHFKLKIPGSHSPLGLVWNKSWSTVF